MTQNLNSQVFAYAPPRAFRALALDAVAAPAGPAEKAAAR